MEPGTPKILAGIDAHVVGRRQTGNETYVVNLANALACRTDVKPLVYMDAGSVWPVSGGPETRKLSWRSSFLRIPLELPTRARRDGCDLLHVQYVAPPELRLKLTVRHAVRVSSALVTVSEFTRGRIVRHYGVDPDRIVVTPNGVGDRWHPVPRDEALARLADLALPASFVLAVGNLHPRKNIPRLVRAIAAARRAGAGDLHLVLAGQPWWRTDEIDRAIEQAAAGNWVHFLGYVDDATLLALYSCASVVAYPSLYEGFGLPVLEALACGAVLVASSATSIPEVAGDAAILFDPEDEAAMADAIATAVTDEPTRARLRRAAPLQTARFTWDRCAELTVSAYRAALARHA